MVGAGTTSTGSSPAGSGTPETSAPLVRLAPFRHPVTARALSGRRLDERTRDYVMLPDGNVAGMGTAEQDVFLALTSHVFRARVRRIQRITTALEAEYRAAVDFALAPLVRRRLVQVISVTAQRIAPGRASFRVIWRDLSTGADRTFQGT